MNAPAKLPGQTTALRLLDVLETAILDAEINKTGARLADYAEHIRALIAELRAVDLRRCRICGFVVDVSKQVERPELRFEMQGRRGLREEAEDTNRAGGKPSYQGDRLRAADELCNALRGLMDRCEATQGHKFYDQVKCEWETARAALAAGKEQT